MANLKSFITTKLLDASFCVVSFLSLDILQGFWTLRWPSSSIELVMLRMVSTVTAALLGIL